MGVGVLSAQKKTLLVYFTYLLIEKIVDPGIVGSGLDDVLIGAHRVVAPCVVGVRRGPAHQFLTGLVLVEVNGSVVQRLFVVMENRTSRVPGIGFRHGDIDSVCLLHVARGIVVILCRNLRAIAAERHAVRHVIVVDERHFLALQRLDAIGCTGTRVLEVHGYGARLPVKLVGEQSVVGIGLGSAVHLDVAVIAWGKHQFADDTAATDAEPRAVKRLIAIFLSSSGSAVVSACRSAAAAAISTATSHKPRDANHQSGQHQQVSE